MYHLCTFRASGNSAYDIFQPPLLIVILIIDLTIAPMTSKLLLNQAKLAPHNLMFYLIVSCAIRK